GTQVVDNMAVDRLRESRNRMYELFNNVMEEAAANGSDLKDYVVASLAFIQLFRYREADKMRVLFIECREHDYLFYREQVERGTQGQVVTMFLEDLAID